MGFSIGGSFGPFRASVRLGGGRVPTQSDPETTVLMLGVALLSAGGWGAEQGLRGNWGASGRVFGWLFIIATILSLTNRYVATFFLTSWLYRLLAVLGYFDWMTSFIPDAAALANWESVDEFTIFVLQSVLGLALLGLMVALPPALVFLCCSRIAQYISNPLDGVAHERDSSTPSDLDESLSGYSEEPEDPEPPPTPRSLEFPPPAGPPVI